MSPKQRGQDALNRNAPDSSRADPGATPDKFRANVFTWTGPGVENIFIDFEPATQQRRRRLWKDGVAKGGVTTDELPLLVGARPQKNLARDK